MILLVLVWLSLFSGSLAYSRTSNHLSIWARLEYLAGKTFLDGLNQSSEYDAIANALSQPNITFFLPNEAAMQQVVSSGALNFTYANETIPKILRHTLMDKYRSGRLLNERQYLLSNDSTHLPLVVGPSPQNDTILQVGSGLVTANAIIQDIQCSNGIIHIIDQFLLPPIATLPTIETIDELQTHELLMKSLNLTTVVSGPNKTVLAPINEAWADANSSTMPYGTLVHNLKYQVIDGIYLSTSLFPSSPVMTVTLDTLRRDCTLTFQRSDKNNLLIYGKSKNDVARVVRSDVITTEGVIHLVDRVLSADLKLGDGTATANDQGGQLAAAPADDPSDIPPPDARKGAGSSLRPSPSSLVIYALIYTVFFV
ncbi:FAS1 domain-containing protein [Fennellomyces sp. T-0311]|nr:FAS1 domain-containing protein [Fennellomyces sp. T-0311]